MTKHRLNLVWMDLEMTGLDPEWDRIIEIASGFGLKKTAQYGSLDMTECIRGKAKDIVTVFRKSGAW